ncbi:hypothetical protein Aperf_G00000079008 [Anoplocephala perfoliata]
MAMASGIHLLFLLIFSCFHQLNISEAAQFNITSTNNDSDIVADLSSAFVDLICPPSHPIWFLPQASINPKRFPDNRLRVDLAEQWMRSLQRGYYVCCPRARVQFPHITVQLVQTPSCCPCCSWPEEEYCSPDLWSTSSEIGAPFCLQAFLFTGSISCTETTLTLPWRSKVLIPCPAPSPNLNLRVYSQIVKIKPSRRLWFNSSMTDVGHFDPRSGVCTTQELVPSGFRQLTCLYPKSKCVIKPQDPLAPPTILPNVTCRLLPIKEHVVMRNTTVPKFRVFDKQNLTVSCTALYSNIFIARRTPTICFRWRVNTESLQQHASNWSRHKCVLTKTLNDPTTVYATSDFNLTTQESSMNVSVEIVERNRATIAQIFSIHFLVTPSTKSNKMFVNISYPDDSSSYNLFSNNTTQNQTLLLLDTSLKHLKLGFYALNEISSETVCSSSTLTRDHFSLTRTLDRWLCDITLPTYKFDVFLQQGDLETMITVYPSPSTLFPRSTLSGLRGSVDVPINVSCSLTGARLPTQFNITIYRIHWLIYRGEELFDEAYTNTSNLIIPPLVNSTSVEVKPILELLSASNTSLQQFLLNLSSLSLPPVKVFSRRLCVVCETFFTLGGSIKSDKECVTLEAKGEPREYNLYAFEAGLLRFSPNFTPIQISEVSNPSFRITTAYPFGELTKNGSISLFNIYEGSDLELRCSVSRTSDSTNWPLIHFADYSGNYSLPNGMLQLFALPFTLESRLRMNISTVKTSDEGAYLCGTVNEAAVPLYVNVVASRAPEIVEPNQQVRYFTANEIVRLTCRAVGGPEPMIMWRLVNDTQNDKILLKWCNESHSSEENSCTLVYVPPPETKNVTIECKALNYIGSDTFSLSIIRISTANELTGSVLSSRLWKNYVFWIIVPLVAIICFSVCLGSCLWRKSRQMVRAEKLIKMDNLIYGRPNKIPEGIHALDPIYQELLLSLMPTEELRDRWCLDRRNLRPFPQPLGNGHYGTVQKGIYYGSRERKHASAFFVALKSPSSEMASLSCFRNEIAHLMKLSDGPNIVKMIGCAFGEKGDLRDTLLVLEFCPNTSLSSFVRRMLYPRGCYDNRPVFIRNAEGGISTGSTQISTTPSPTSDGSQFVWEAYNAPARIILNDYEETIPSTPRLQSKGRRRRISGGRRRNTALVYQRLTRNSTSIFLQIATGISRGLEYLAQNNVIHRDLATRNILMDSKFDPKICDFGLAVTVDTPQDCSNGFCQQQPSSGCYHIITFAKQLPFRILPPEALSKQLFYLSSDIWEFGLLLWQMFFFETRKPFENVQNSDALLRLLSSGHNQVNHVIPEASGTGNQAPPSIDRPPAIPDALWDVICDCLRFRASERPSASEVHRRLDDCYSSYEEISDEFVIPEQESNYHRLCRMVPSQENSFGGNFLQDALEEPIPHLATYENIEQARNSYGYLESFPSSSI